MKIDLGCGCVVREGYVRIDNNPIHHPDVLIDMQEYVTGLKENTVDHAIANNCLEFLDGWELYELMNHLHRAIKPTGRLDIVVVTVVLPNGGINTKAWMVPLLKTRFSPDTFQCFSGGSTLEFRGVLPWETLHQEHYSNGSLHRKMAPKK